MAHVGIQERIGASTTAATAYVAKSVLETHSWVRGGSAEGSNPGSIVTPSIVTRVQGTRHRHYHVLAYRFVERVGQGHVRPTASSPSGQGGRLISDRSCVRFAPRLPCATWRSRKRSIRLPVRMSLFQRDGAGSTPCGSTPLHRPGGRPGPGVRPRWLSLVVAPV